MHKNTKIATCCYCGTRSALVLGRDRHELVCATCGAPLHELKMLPLRDKPVKTKSGAPAEHYSSRPKPSKPKKRKRKSKAKWFLEEAVDFLEDVFD